MALPCNIGAYFQFPGLPLPLHLHLPQFIKHALFLQQFFICTVLFQSPFTDHRDMIGIFNRRKPVRHNERCPVLYQMICSDPYFFFRNTVKRRSRLV